MGDLTLQIAQVYPVEINQDQFAYTGGCQIHCDRRSQSTQSDNQRPGREQPFLPGNVNGREHDLTAVAEKLLIIHELKSGFVGKV